MWKTTTFTKCSHLDKLCNAIDDAIEEVEDGFNEIQKNMVDYKIITKDKGFLGAAQLQDECQKLIKEGYVINGSLIETEHALLQSMVKWK